jgi:hypothetical protein
MTDLSKLQHGLSPEKARILKRWIAEKLERDKAKAQSKGSS